MTTRRIMLPPASISWDEQNIPRNLEYDDIYFLPGQGAAESDYVYLQGNKLRQRWAKSPPRFAIGETGFGCGLNFILSAALWAENSSTGARLDYYSVENTPPAVEDLRRALEPFAAHTLWVEELLAQYPPRLPGFHTLHFPNNIHLHLLFGEVEDMLSQLRLSDRAELLGELPGELLEAPLERGPTIDAWFLDGFSPYTNPDMWTTKLFDLITELSAPGTSCATFTAASDVRRGLTARGFKMHTCAGFGRKRHMLLGQFDPTQSSNADVNTPSKLQRTSKHSQHSKDFPAAAWYLNREALTATPPRSIAVIGAGLAGSCSAFALAQRGLKCTVYEQADHPAAGGSGNKAAAFYSRFSEFASAENDFALHSYLYAARFYAAHSAGSPTGLLQYLQAEEQASAKQLVTELDCPGLLQYLEAQAASACSGIPGQRAALFFPEGRSVNIAELCQQLLAADNIDAHYNQAIAAVKSCDDGVHLLDKQGGLVGQADAVVICCGPQSPLLTDMEWLSARPIRGQTTELPASANSRQLRTIVCDDHYLTPAVNGLHTVGSSYVTDDQSIELRVAEHASNIDAARTLLGEESVSADAAISTGWAGLRFASTDYLPVVGPVPDLQRFQKRFADLRHDKNRPINAPGCYLRGIYMNTAYGSRGLSFAPLCAEFLAAMLNKEPAVLPSKLRHALLPARFIVRNITRSR